MRKPNRGSDTRTDSERRFDEQIDRICESFQSLKKHRRAFVFGFVLEGVNEKGVPVEDVNKMQKMHMLFSREVPTDIAALMTIKSVGVLIDKHVDMSAISPGQRFEFLTGEKLPGSEGDKPGGNGMKIVEH